MIMQSAHAAITRPIGTQFRKLSGAVTDLLFPPRCVACQAWGAPFCDGCAQQVEPVPRPRCHHCGRPQRKSIRTCVQCQQVSESALTLTRSAALHTHPLREAIHAFKYENRPELAPLLARYLVTVFRSDLRAHLSQPIDLVVPVPLHEQRLRERGYNQAELLASALARAEHLALGGDCLLRIRSTATQVGMTASQRQQNVAYAFRATDYVQGRTVLLIDDVCTTGSTLRSCASALAEAGARTVYALSLATPTLD